MENESEKNHWTAAFHHAEKYASLKYELYKYELVEKTALVGSAVTTSVMNSVVLAITLFLLILAGAFAIGEYTGHLYLGFAFAAGFFLVVFLVMRLCRRSIRRKVLNFYLRKAFDHETA